MKTLYISDLDGTLLDESAQLPEASRDALNAMLGDELQFSVATARSHTGAIAVVGGVNFILPALLLNGSLYYDLRGGKILRIAAFTPDVARLYVDVYERNGLIPILYTCDGDDVFHNYYRELGGGAHAKHFGSRVSSGDPRYRKVEGFAPVYESERCFFVSTIDEAEKVTRAEEELREAGLSCNAYDDIYTGARLLESCLTDKGKAAIELKRMVGADELVAIGDNLNDLPMLKAADRAIAVANACPEVLAIADEIIPPCGEQGVVTFLRKEMRHGAR